MEHRPKTKKQLEKEIEKLRGQVARLEKKPVRIRQSESEPERKQRPEIIRAAVFLPKYQDVVVDEHEALAYPHPEYPMIANKRKFWGKTQGEYQTGEAVSIKMWYQEPDFDMDAQGGKNVRQRKALKV